MYGGNDYSEDVIYMAATLYVPRGKTAIYSMTEGWQKFLNVMETDTKFKLTYMLDGTVYRTYEIQATEVVPQKLRIAWRSGVFTWHACQFLVLSFFGERFFI